jgi:spermidine synthase
MRKLATVVTPYQRVAVWGSDGEREFRVAGATHAWWHRDFLLSGLAWDNMAAAALLGPNGPPQSLLMLGLAGGTTLRVLRHLLPGLQMTAVEIDSDIVALARDHMELDRLGVDVHIGDAYEWLCRSRRKFDVVVDDVYGVTPDDVVRPGLYDESACRAIAARVTPGGLFIANLVTGRGHRRLQSAFRSFFRENFPAVRSVTTPAGANEALVGGAGVLSGRSLGPWSGRFGSVRDREHWWRIRVRRLQAR